MALREYHKVNLETGERLDVLLFDDEIDTIPEDCKLGWGEGFYDPKWDVTENKWIEGADLSVLLPPLREQKIAELSDECNRRIEGTFEHNGDVFQFNMKDQSNFNQQLSILILDPTIQNVLWKTENNGVKNFTREEFISACKAGELHKRNNIGRYWQLKNHVMTYPFGSIGELNSIDFDFVISTNTNTNTGG